ncbi:site-specific integrase [Trinickia diaoshuihuensis]|uniref:site-specific integrase n=1 Tax=Trinickia diaoshuihuensis TaxID=2292265 RepID=UPI000E254583|nr:site-specific integrase [Trinickia diaoshuihuensis]
MTLPSPISATPDGFPDANELAALRAWYAGLSVRKAVEHYLSAHVGEGHSARGILGQMRRQLIAVARQVHRDDLAALFAHPASERHCQANAAGEAIEALRYARAPEPHIGDDVGTWLPARAVAALRAHCIDTQADLTVCIPRRRQWWRAVPGLGAAGARSIEAFFANHPVLTERTRALIAAQPQAEVVPWESLCLPHEVDGSAGSFRAPRPTCALDANNDYEAVQAWLSLHESPATQRTYRKDSERLIIWSILERGRALSSLTTEDAIAYRAFLRRPVPSERWIGPIRSRSSLEWRPFTEALSARSTAHALSVPWAMFRWLVEQRYVLANPFAGVKVRGGGRGVALDASHAFSEGEWQLVRTLADGLEYSEGWALPAAQRLRFVLDLAYATGLRASELVNATLRHVVTDERGDHWLNLVGKGHKVGKAAMPPLARAALTRHLLERRLPVTSSRWQPETPLIATLDEEGEVGITAVRLWGILRRFFRGAAMAIESDHPALAGKLRRASPHWMRHTHATHALVRGAELTTVRDNLRHSSISTTSIYLHSDEVRPAQQMAGVFGAGK